MGVGGGGVGALSLKTKELGLKGISYNEMLQEPNSLRT